MRSVLCRLQTSPMPVRQEERETTNERIMKMDMGKRQYAIIRMMIPALGEYQNILSFGRGSTRSMHIFPKYLDRS